MSGIRNRSGHEWSDFHHMHIFSYLFRGYTEIMVLSTAPFALVFTRWDRSWQCMRHLLHAACKFEIQRSADFMIFQFARMLGSSWVRALCHPRRHHGRHGRKTHFPFGSLWNRWSVIRRHKAHLFRALFLASNIKHITWVTWVTCKTVQDNVSLYLCAAQNRDPNLRNKWSNMSN